MAVDKREQILLRLVDIAKTVSGIVTVVRNRGLLDNDKRPSINILDGDERAVLTGGNKVLQRPGFTPQIMLMTPEVWILLKDQRPSNKKDDNGDGSGENIGSILNAFRLDIVQKITTDATLLALLGSNGGIVLNGTTAALKTGTVLDGQMRLDFGLQYVFNPN
jgi:hypothetical protein